MRIVHTRGVLRYTARTMLKNKKSKKEKQGVRGEKGMLGGIPSLPSGGQFFSNMVSALLVFLIIATLYSMVSGGSSKVSEIAISSLAQDISAGAVKSNPSYSCSIRYGIKRRSARSSAKACSQTATLA